MLTLIEFVGLVIVIESKRCWEEGSVIWLLHAPRMHQSVTEKALQFSSCFMHGLGDTSQERSDCNLTLPHNSYRF